MSATGNGALSYQWYHDGRPISGATGDSYSHPVNGIVDAGAYWVAVTDGIGTRFGGPFFAIWGPAATEIVGWGYNGSGQVTIPSGLTTAVAVDVGWDSAIALKRDGTVTAWGNTSFAGNLPQGLNNVVAVAVRRTAALVLKADGTVVGIGDATNVPAGLRNVVAIDCGASFAVALKSDGTVATWPGPATPLGLTHVVAVSAGDYHVLALKADGTVVAWGQNPAMPAGLSDVVGIAAGMYHSLVLKSDGTVVAFAGSGYQMTPPA